MHVTIHPDRPHLGAAAAAEAEALLVAACRARGRATLVVATGASQFEVLAVLAASREIPWQTIEVFHLDEYVGLGDDHPAGFVHYLRERFLERLPRSPAAFHALDGRADPAAECVRLARLVPQGDFDLAMVGIGENAHLAFNDPPADFTTTQPYIVVPLDDPCRRQQVGEGWFPSLADVPTRAISMSVRRILASRAIICSVPGPQKAMAVRASVEGPLTPAVPASILREHADCRLHLDTAAASLLTRTAGG